MILLQKIIDSKYHYQPSWVMIVIVLSVMIIGYLFSAFHSRFIAVIKAFFTNRFAEQLSREEHSLSHPSSVFLSFNFLVTSSLFILQIASSSNDYSFLHLTFAWFLIVMAFVFSIYLVKISALKILGFIFDQPNITNEYIFIIFLVNQMVGISFIPIIIFIAYGQLSLATIFIYAGIAFLILAFIMRVGKGALAISSSGEMSPVYLFLYLCTLEILPLLLGIKLIEKLL